MASRKIIVIVFVALLVLAVGVFYAQPTLFQPSSNQSPLPTVDDKAEFVGSQQCAQCHQQQYQRWQQSHHRHAFAKANASTVLGNFDSVPVAYSDGTAVFERQSIDSGSRFQIRLQTEHKSEVYPVNYTLGHYPLQQYLLETEPGNFQVFALAWDARAEQDGGQRWIELQPGESDDPGNAFHWKRYFQNWNSQCADCHTTNFSKGYQSATQTSAAQYHSQWSEAGVGCEACHGPASQHLQWANGELGGAVVNESAVSKRTDNKGLIRTLNSVSQWQFEHGQSIASNKSPVPDHAKASASIDSCASCHSLRHPLDDRSFHGMNKPFANQYSPRLVGEPMYFIDGQIREEVFVYGSFTQSKMHRAGVSCSNCHDVHSGLVNGFNPGQIAAPGNDAVCAQCHRADIYASESHHHHRVETEAARCVTCHMPEQTYMLVDPRRDHGFHIPSPALSELAGTPNVCTDCHSDQTNGWAAAAIAGWVTNASQESASKTGDSENKADFASWQLEQQRLFSSIANPSTRAAIQGNKALQANERQRYELILSEQTPAMKKAMLLSAMPVVNAEAYQTLQAGLQSEEALLRLAAVERASEFDLATREALLMPLLNDSMQSVRLAATLGVADLLLQPDFTQQPLLAQRVEQFVDSYKKHEDLLASQLALANIYSRTEQWSLAINAYEKALTLVPNSMSSMINLADIYRQQNRDSEGEQVLQRAIAVAKREASYLQSNSTPLASEGYRMILSQQATAEYALGLLYIRAKNYSLALQILRSATQSDSENPQIFYAYLLALDAMGQRPQALQLLHSSALRHQSEALQQLFNHWQNG